MLAWNWMNAHTGNEGRKLRFWSAGRQMLVSSLFFLQSFLYWGPECPGILLFPCLHARFFISLINTTLWWVYDMSGVEGRCTCTSCAVCSVQGREHAVCFWRLYSTCNCNCNSSAGREGRRWATCRRYSNNKHACQVTHYCSCRVQYIHPFYVLGSGNGMLVQQYVAESQQHRPGVQGPAYPPLYTVCIKTCI